MRGTTFLTMYGLTVPRRASGESADGKQRQQFMHNTIAALIVNTEKFSSFAARLNIHIFRPGVRARQRSGVRMPWPERGQFYKRFSP